jgi:hypothetical protein
LLRPPHNNVFFFRLVEFSLADRVILGLDLLSKCFVDLRERGFGDSSATDVGRVELEFLTTYRNPG